MKTNSIEYTDPPWMSEFRQQYPEGLCVIKRSLDATPMVIRKYNIGPDEVMAFSSYQKRKQAISVFHFHPDFAHADRHLYMQQHQEGYEVLEEVLDDHKIAVENVRLERKARMKTFGRSITLAVNAIVLFILTNHPGGR
jgi:hypothetical protein